MNICVFDTETTSLEKPFCYNIGYVLVNTDSWAEIQRREFIIEQIWHNSPLFASAYYADKRPFYVQEMRARRITMEKFGYVMQQMVRDFKNFSIERAFAFNSSFDEKVFDFNCDWFKCINPFDDMPIADIRGFAHNFIVNEEYMKFCEEYGYFTESGNYSTTAETVYKYLTQDNDFIEEHTALADSLIESDILHNCVEAGADLEIDYKARRSIERPIEKTLHVRTVEQTDYYFDYTKIRINKDKTEILLR